jgi:hypothetical protein
MQAYHCLAFAVFLFFFCLEVRVEGAAAAEKGSWQTVAELSAEELAQVDLRQETPRHPQILYLPAEPYPFSPPYTAEEMGYRASEFSHGPRWSHAMVEVSATINASGYMDNAKFSGLTHYIPQDGLAGYIKLKPGEVAFRSLSQDLFPPESYGEKAIFIGFRTAQEFTQRADAFIYTPALRRVRRQPQPRRGDKNPSRAQTLDDTFGRDPWEFSWRILGTDVLWETVRFPLTRPKIILANANGNFVETAAKDLKIMGDPYPYYTSTGGVECYVVEARVREEWLPRYYAPRMLYWLDKHYFYPLRVEQYGRAGELIFIEVRISDLLNPALKERGYGVVITVYWDVTQDILTGSVHDAHQVHQWTEEEEQLFFSPGFILRNWFPGPLRSFADIRSPEEFYLRPALDREKFPRERKIPLSPELAEHIHKQERQGRLFFD